MWVSQKDSLVSERRAAMKARWSNVDTFKKRNPIIKKKKKTLYITSLASTKKCDFNLILAIMKFVRFYHFNLKLLRLLKEKKSSPSSLSLKTIIILLF